MNYLYKPFDNIHIRQAFEVAINKDIISTAIYKGIRFPTCHIVPQGQPGYNAALKCPGGAPTSGNPTLARQLFQQGLQEERLTLATLPSITFTYESNSPTLDNVITTLRQMWQTALGVTVKTQVLDFNPLLTAITNTTCTKADSNQCLHKGLQMWWLAWGADYPDPQDWLTLQFDKGASNNTWNYGQNISTNASTQQTAQQQMEQADRHLIRLLVCPCTTRLNSKWLMMLHGLQWTSATDNQCSKPTWLAKRLLRRELCRLHLMTGGMFTLLSINALMNA